MGKALDLTGRRFGKLVALTRGSDKISKNRIYIRWLCQCDCGGTVEVIGPTLLNGNTKSCGCLQREKVASTMFKDLTGRKFSRLLVEEIELSRDKSNKIRYKCICDCGNKVVVIGADLKSGKTRSCGCLATEFKQIKGILHHNYKQHLHLIKEEIDRKYPAYIDWRNSIYKRDNYSCMCCKVDANKLRQNELKIHAHHIKNFKDYPDCRIDLDNGITLCEKCHLLFHSLYGKIMTNELQLNEFLELYSLEINGGALLS